MSQAETEAVRDDPVEPTQRAIRDLRTAVSLPEALEIVRRWGNRRWRVPVSVDDASPLALTLGIDCARRLVSAFGGQVLELPHERSALRRLREEEIYRQCVELGRSRQQVAIEFGISRTHVKWVIDRVGQERANGKA